MTFPTSPSALQGRLASSGYLAGEALATVLHLALHLGRPLLLEGPAGVGKTALARSLADALDTKLIRLQCYEGISAEQALYEWNYPAQLLAIRLAEARGSGVPAESNLFTENYLVRRPLLAALQEDRPPVLLIDEVDRADAAFEAFLLELLAEWQVTIPELGTVHAKSRPVVLLTANRTRELSDALRRRCLYQWLAFPEAEQERAILALHVPEAPARLVEQVALSLVRLRKLPLAKAPGVAEGIDWLRALVALAAAGMTAAGFQASLAAVLKHPEDFALAQAELRPFEVGADRT